jgi:3-methyladenine DNA glycosylase AlkD
MPAPQTALALKKAMQELANPLRAQHSMRFFKTGKGEYGEGDRFLGLTVPMQRDLVRQFPGLPVEEARKLLASPWHEHRLTGLLIWVRQFAKGLPERQAELHAAYMQAVAQGQVNNWDLVDSSAETLCGAFACGGDGEPKPAFRKRLHALAKSASLWERRVAMIAHFHNIKLGHFDSALEVATLLLGDKEDLMHKAVGWMLREIGKRDRAVLNRFLDQHAATMPRTALRYALEHSNLAEKKRYMEAKARTQAQWKSSQSVQKPVQPRKRSGTK